jgi:hypothetical protein
MSAYPVGYESDFVEQRSRLTTFFRIILAIPHFIVMYVMYIALGFGMVFAWFAIMFTAKYPEGLYTFNARIIQYMTRVTSYASLAADPFPGFGLGNEDGYPVQLPIAPPKERYSRMKAFFRFLIGIPVLLIQYALQVVLQIAAIISWFCIVITGKQNSGLQSALDLGVAYNARAQAYFALLTEDWPPFSPAGTEPLGPGSPAAALETLAAPAPAPVATTPAATEYTPPTPGV